MKIRRDQDASFIAFLFDQLERLPELRSRRMFGGHGVYYGEVFFAIVYQGTLYLKTDATTQPQYEAAGMRPFQLNSKQILKRYYQVPVSVVEDADLLLTWAQAAIQVAQKELES